MRRIFFYGSLPPTLAPHKLGFKANGLGLGLGRMEMYHHPPPHTARHQYLTPALYSPGSPTGLRPIVSIWLITFHNHYRAIHGTAGLTIGPHADCRAAHVPVPEEPEDGVGDGEEGGAHEPRRLGDLERAGEKGRGERERTRYRR